MSPERRYSSLRHHHVLWLMVAFLLLYGLTRWYHLTLLPIHFDEIVYLDRVNRILSRHDFFIGLRDDLRTGHLWIIALLWPFSPDRIWIGRFASTLAGLWGALGVYKSGALLFSNHRIGLIAAMFYLVVPGVLFYDRMALADSLLAACGVWIVYGVAAYFLTLDIRPLWWIGLVVALAMLTKPNGFLFLAIPVLGYLLLRQRSLGISEIAVAALPVVIGGGIAVALMLPFLSNVQEAFLGKAGLYGFSGWINLGERLGQNLGLSAGWLVSLLSIPVAFLAAGGLVVALCSRQVRRQAIYLTSILLVQWLFFALVSEIWYPRYLLPVISSVVLLAAYFTHEVFRLASRPALYVLLAVILAASFWPALYTDFWLLIDPSRAPLHPDEARQYITGWPSGYGLREVATLVRGLAANHPEIYITYTDGIMARRGLRYYLPDQPPNIEFESFDPFEGETIKTLNTMAASRPTFVVLNTAHEKGLDDFFQNPTAFPQAKHTFRVTRPGGMTSWDVYQWVLLDEPGH